MIALPRIFDDKNCLWSVPLIAGACGYGFFQLRGADGPAMRAIVETVVASGIGFVLAAAASLLYDMWLRMKTLPSRAEQYGMLEEQRGALSALKGELRGLESGLQTYLAAKKAEGIEFRETLLDIGNDIGRLKSRNPTDELREQLRMIADKFGDLAGLRAATDALNARMGRIDNLTAELREAQARSNSQGSADWFAAIEEQVAELRRNVSTASQLSNLENERRQAMDDVKASFKDELRQGVQNLLANTDQKELAQLVGVAQNDAMQALERRMVKMSRTIESLQARVEELRFASTEDAGIPSIFRSVQGVGTADPNNKLKTGCLAKLFEANVALKRALAA